MVEVGPQRVLGSLVWHVDGDYLYQFIPQISDYLWLQYTETNELSVQWVTRTIKHNYINIIFLRTGPPALSHHSEHISLADREGTDQYRGGTRRWQQVHLMWSSQFQKEESSRKQRTNKSISGLLNMLTLLQTDHFWMIWWKKWGDVFPRGRIHIMVHGGRERRVLLWNVRWTGKHNGCVKCFLTHGSLFDWSRFGFVNMSVCEISTRML